VEWGFIILLVLAVPIVIIWPLLIWAGAMSGLYQLIRNKVRGRATANRRSAVGTAGEAGSRKTPAGK
jgi:hypothetical protein